MLRAEASLLQQQSIDGISLLLQYATGSWPRSQRTSRKCRWPASQRSTAACSAGIVEQRNDSEGRGGHGLAKGMPRSGTDAADLTMLTRESRRGRLDVVDELCARPLGGGAEVG